MAPGIPTEYRVHTGWTHNRCHNDSLSLEGLLLWNELQTQREVKIEGVCSSFASFCFVLLPSSKHTPGTSESAPLRQALESGGLDRTSSSWHEMEDEEVDV